MPRATAVLREKEIDEGGNIVELVVWRVPERPHDASGVRDRLATTPAVLYDNHSPKGHHRHVEGVEETYSFVDLDRLFLDFKADVKRLREKP